MKRVAVSALAFVAFVARAVVEPNQASVADLTPAIGIGDYTASCYLFEKSYNQFVTSSTHHEE